MAGWHWKRKSTLLALRSSRFTSQDEFSICQDASRSTCAGRIGISAVVENPHANDFIANKSDERRFRRRNAVDPILSVIALRIALAHFVVRGAGRAEYHFLVH